MVHIEGVGLIDDGVLFEGAGTIEVDLGGHLTVKGTVGAGQKLLLTDGTGDVTIADVSLFHARVGLTEYGGDRIHLDGVLAKSAAVVDGDLLLYSGKHQNGTVAADFPSTSSIRRA